MTLPEDKYAPRYLSVLDMVPAKIKEWQEMSVMTASRLGWGKENVFAKVEQDNLAVWMRQPNGALRPDTTPVVHPSLGEAIWSLIRACMP